MGNFQYFYWSRHAPADDRSLRKQGVYTSLPFTAPIPDASMDQPVRVPLALDDSLTDANDIDSTIANVQRIV